MGTTYLDRLRTAEALIERSRGERERKAFEEIAAIWRRLAARESGAHLNLRDDPTPGT